VEQDRVDHAEDGSTRGDPKAERDDRDNGEGRGLEELAESETEIIHRIADW
jgi:hypothetical protein